jgi:hypothetical protein
MSPLPEYHLLSLLVLLLSASTTSGTVLALVLTSVTCDSD